MILWSAVALPFMPLFANSFGWIFTEMGRQPWAVFGLMTTARAVSPGVSTGEALTSLITLTLLYGVLAVVEVEADAHLHPPGGRRGSADPRTQRRGRGPPARLRLLTPAPDEETPMELTTVWFALIAVLWMGYFALEGFDFGVGMLLPVLAGDDTERRVLINTIGPVWDGNEVWVLVAGGATFAAFPEWYATLFSGFYLPLLLILVALIVRGLAFEYRAKRDDDRWRARWDAAIIVGSVRPRPPVGRGVRQHPARRADRRRQGVRRRLLHPALPLRPARRADDAAAVPHPRRDVHRPEDRRADPAWPPVGWP